MLAIGAWAVAFLLAANLRESLGRYLASQWTNFAVDYVYLLAFGIIAIVTFVVLLVLIRAGTRGPKGVSSIPFVDALLAGSLGVVLGVLIMTATSVILATFYGPTAPGERPSKRSGPSGSTPCSRTRPWLRRSSEG